MLTRLLKSAIALAALALPAAALGDIPPPKDYVEMCTVEKACGKADEARGCRRHVSEAEKCKAELAKDGWTYKCRSAGASNFTEIWCRAKKAPK